jgi:hypothetical protein
MKSLIVVFSRILHFLMELPVSKFSKSALTEFNCTSTWVYPYFATEEKARRITDGIKIMFNARRGTPVAKLIEVLGAPDQIDDLHNSFQGLSVDEDCMFSNYRRHLSYRLVWYITKHSASEHSLNDMWLAAYTGNKGDGVVKVVTNKIDESHC